MDENRRDSAGGLSRRDVLGATAMLAVGRAGLAPAEAQGAAGGNATNGGAVTSTGNARPPLTLFSRHLQWTDIEEAVEVTASAGFGAIAWTVRPGSHITPQAVARDLPRAVQLAHRAGLGTPLIATSLTDADSPYAESIVETAAGLGIRTYRAASYHYEIGGDLPTQQDAMRRRVDGLARLNERHGATALFHTHSGDDLLGGSVWDLWLLLRDFDPDRVAINFDTGHGSVGAGSGWTHAVRFARRHIRSLSLKDFRWRQDAAGRRRWIPEICPPGQGMANIREMFSYFQATGFHGPAEVQFEYTVQVRGRPAPVSLMALDVGEWKLEMAKADFVALLRRDAQYFSALLRETGLAPARDMVG